MEEKCRAIVLRAVDYKDNDKILTLFSLEYGIISSAIRGVKKPKAKLKFAAQPFCFCEYVFNVKGDKRSVISADIIESFYPTLDANYLVLAIAGLILSLVSQMGDLWASLIKRERGIKDYSRILPGHGGLMDRFDSCLPVSTVLLVLCMLFPPFLGAV